MYTFHGLKITQFRSTEAQRIMSLIWCICCIGPASKSLKPRIIYSIKGMYLIKCSQCIPCCTQAKHKHKQSNFGDTCHKRITWLVVLMSSPVCHSSIKSYCLVPPSGAGQSFELRPSPCLLRVNPTAVRSPKPEPWESLLFCIEAHCGGKSIVCRADPERTGQRRGSVPPGGEVRGGTCRSTGPAAIVPRCSEQVQ